ncbi:putative membrane protein [Campylobacter vicugnae]|uniref:Membrane protein n=1 Tax=Campylobacter vicugnae TaxID=1660076 RepID=A0A1X9T2D5_9BACT|nr:hypothetical protein [Campylobacter sp. RM8964]ARR02670.1 putative membrane protein [Campylobacter sp. RM8964]
MGSNKHVDWYFDLYVPTVVDRYDKTIKINREDNNMYSLEVTALKTLLNNKFNGASSKDSFEANLKKLREIHHIGMSRRLRTFAKNETGNLKTLDTKKIEKEFGSPVVTIENSIHTDIMDRYLQQETGGKVKDLDEFFDHFLPYIDKEVKAEIKKKNEPAIRAFRTGIGGERNASKINFIEKNGFLQGGPPSVVGIGLGAEFYLDYYYNATHYTLLHYLDLQYSYLGGGLYDFQVTYLCEVCTIRESRGYDTYTKTFVNNFTISLPDYISGILEILDGADFRLVELQNGRVVKILMSDNRFFTILNKKIEFSPPVALKGIHLDEKEARYTRLIRQRLGYEEIPYKKKNREEKILDGIAGNSKVVNAEIGLFLDLFPFKNKNIRRKKEWQLFLKGVMKYFCSIAGVPAEGGMGFVSVRVPNNVSYVRYDGGGGDGKGQHGQFLNINIQKRYRDTKPPEVCFFSQQISNRNVLLHLVTSDGKDGYFEYILDYSFFYRGIASSGTATGIGLGLTAGDAVFNYLNKERFDFYFGHAKAELRDFKSPSSPGALQILEKYFEFEIELGSSSSTVDLGGRPIDAPIHKLYFNRTVTETQNVYQAEFKYHYNFTTGGDNWDSHSGEGTYISSIYPTENSLNPYEHIDTIKGLRARGEAFWDNANDDNRTQIDWENKGSMQDGFVGANIHPRLPMPIRLWNSIPYRGKFVAYNSSLLIKTRYKERVKVQKGWVKFVAPVIQIVGAVIAYFFPPVGVAIIATGTVVAIAGVLLDIEWMTMVGAAAASGAAIGWSAGGSSGGIGSAITSALTSPMTYISLAVNLALNMYGSSLEAKIKGMQNELKEMEENWEKEVDSRVNPLGGIGKTSSGGDEDFDNFYSLMDQEYLAQSLFLASDVEMSSPVFNDSKYDNTRKV